MNYSIIVLSSVTAAKRAEKMAERYGISCTTSHTPKVISQYGCSHCIKVKPQYTQNVVDICRELQLDVKGVFTEIRNGDFVDYEEVRGYQ